MRERRSGPGGAAALLSRVKAHIGVAGRVEGLSGLLLGRPYVANGLVGSADVPEKFVASLEAFDCVTYVETVLALSLASTAEEFPEWLRRIRYDGGRVTWKRRNHYMTGWIRNNARLGVVRPLPMGARAVRKDRLLDAVPGLSPRRARFACVPKKTIEKLSPGMETGDLVFFASTRPHLDVFHCGILVRDGDRLRMRHAARSRGGVVEQDLDEFLKSNRMAGVLLVRPVGVPGA